MPLNAGGYLFFSFPLGNTVVIGGVGRSDAPDSFGAEVSFFGFFTILLLR